MWGLGKEPPTSQSPSLVAGEAGSPRLFVDEETRLREVLGLRNKACDRRKNQILTQVPLGTLPYMKPCALPSSSRGIRA